jgi:hypothetical protein
MSSATMHMSPGLPIMKSSLLSGCWNSRVPKDELHVDEATPEKRSIQERRGLILIILKNKEICLQPNTCYLLSHSLPG